MSGCDAGSGTALLFSSLPCLQIRQRSLPSDPLRHFPIEFGSESTCPQYRTRPIHFAQCHTTDSRSVRILLRVYSTTSPFTRASSLDLIHLTRPARPSMSIPTSTRRTPSHSNTVLGRRGPASSRPSTMPPSESTPTSVLPTRPHLRPTLDIHVETNARVWTLGRRTNERRTCPPVAADRTTTNPSPHVRRARARTSPHGRNVLVKRTNKRVQSRLSTWRTFLHVHKCVRNGRQGRDCGRR